MAMKRIFGDIPGLNHGDTFESRRELAASGVHRPTQAGISGDVAQGADSIVLSGGYEDDEDFGDVIIYTGFGGRDPNSGKHVADQLLEKQNLALAKNRDTGLPVRVSRSHKHRSNYSPKHGYQYGGLYYVRDYWSDRGRSGFAVWRYRLEAKNVPMWEVREPPVEYKIPDRKQGTIQRIVRDTALSRRVKSLHGYRCQVCRIEISISSGPYAEAAHIQPLGAPHNGPDVEGNILCLCPNHHVMFDSGAFMISDSLDLMGITGKLAVEPGHAISKVFLKYHRDLHQGKLPDTP